MAGEYRTGILLGAALALGLAACGGGGSGGKAGFTEEFEAATDKATALAAAIEASRATGGDGRFDDTPHMIGPSVAAMHDGEAAAVAVTDGGGAFAARLDGPASIAGWTGARFERGAAAERLTVYADVGAPEAMAFVPENLNRLNEVSGLTGEAIPAAGLAVEDDHWPLVVARSLAAASARGSVTYGTTGTGADEGLSFTGSFGGAAGGYVCSGAACSVRRGSAASNAAAGGDSGTGRGPVLACLSLSSPAATCTSSQRSARISPLRQPVTPPRASASSRYSTQSWRRVSRAPRLSRRRCRRG